MRTRKKSGSTATKPTKKFKPGGLSEARAFYNRAGIEKMQHTEGCYSNLSFMLLKIFQGVQRLNMDAAYKAKDADYKEACDFALAAFEAALERERKQLSFGLKSGLKF